MGEMCITMICSKCMRPFLSTFVTTRRFYAECMKRAAEEAEKAGIRPKNTA
jgi:hypothetical protein